MNDRISLLVKQLKLDPHPEGGFFKEYYRSAENIPQNALPQRFKGSRCFSTSIYYLIDGKFPSKFHRLSSDEIWHFYEGSPVDLHIITETGKHEIISMGMNAGISAGSAGSSAQNVPLYQYVIEKNNWFGGIVHDPESYTLLGCTVAPGFDFEDFEMADKKTMLGMYPQHREIIGILT